MGAQREIMQNIKVAVDAVVFGYRDNQIQILLIKQKYGDKQWALPGGFVKDNESLDEAVLRELEEETKVKLNYVEQLYTYGDVNRDPRFRVVSIAYLGLVNPDNYILQANTDAQDAQWFSIDAIPSLAYDHNEILNHALSRLKAKVNYKPIGFELLDAKFPFSDIENLYQTILDQNIDRRNFRKKLLSFGFIEDTGEIHKPASGRPGKLFRFNSEKYKEVEQKGFLLEIKFV